MRYLRNREERRERAPSGACGVCTRGGAELHPRERPRGRRARTRRARAARSRRRRARARRRVHERIESCVKRAAPTSRDGLAPAHGRVARVAHALRARARDGRAVAHAAHTKSARDTPQPCAATSSITYSTSSSVVISAARARGRARRPRPARPRRGGAGGGRRARPPPAGARPRGRRARHQHAREYTAGPERRGLARSLSEDESSGCSMHICRGRAAKKAAGHALGVHCTP